MPSAPRLTKIDCPYNYLEAGDQCFYYGEYTAGRDFREGETNNWINNLKKKPTVPAGQLYWKGKAVEYWADVLQKALPPKRVMERFTFVPMPGSKPAGHVDYDPRMLSVLQLWAKEAPQVDVRPLLFQTHERSAQHEKLRLTPRQILESLGIDKGELRKSLARNIVVVDDVITRGASFKAAQELLASLRGVHSVQGIFLAIAVRPPVVIDDDDS